MWIQAETGYTARRRHMVETQLVARGISDPRVLEAMAAIPREEFVPEFGRERGYADEPVSIGFGQTLSQPYITALMSEVLGLRGGEKVLEVGAGSGYHAAVLGRLAARVIALEILSELAETARDNLARTGCQQNVVVLCEDGSLGWPPEAPYDAISVAAAAPAVPAALMDQLADGGRLVIPVGARDEQALELIERQGDRYQTRIVTHCRFVPLRGREGWD